LAKLEAEEERHGDQRTQLGVEQRSTGTSI